MPGYDHLFNIPQGIQTTNEYHSFSPSNTGIQSWSPEGEFGHQGEFQGWKSQEESIPYKQNWDYGNMPEGEFTTGPNTFNPFRLSEDPITISDVTFDPSSTWSGPGPWNDFGLDYNNMPTQSNVFEDPDLLGMTGEVDMTQAASADAIDKLKAQGIPDETIIQIFGKDAFDIWNESNFPIGYSTETSNLENFDYYHYRRNGYTHDETMQILEEQGLV